jgi:hypothetical protein
MIFESMLTEAESVEQWLKRFLPTYLRGIPITDTTTQNLIKAAGDSYDPKNLEPFKQSMLKLANALFATSQAPGYGGDEAPAGAGGAGAGGAGAGGAGAGGAGTAAAAAPAKTGTSTDSIVNSLQSLLAKLKGIDPALHAEIVKKIGAGQSLQGLPGGGSKPATPAAPPAPVSESRKRRK